MEILLLLLVFAPCVGAILFLIGAIPQFFRGNRSNYLALFWVSISLVCTIAVVKLSLGIKSKMYSFGEMPWIEGKIKLFGALIDPLSLIMLVVVSVVGFFVVLFSTEYMSLRNREHPIDYGRGRYYGWLLLFIGSMIGIAISPNLLQFLIFWELTTFSSAALIAHYEKDEGIRAGFKAFLMTHAPGAFFFVAIALLFVYTKSFSFSAIGELPNGIKILTVIFLIIAAWSKSAQGPFYTWLPDAMSAPTPVSAYLHGAAMVKAGVFLVARTFTSGFQIPYEVGLIVAVVAIFTMYLGLLFYFLQDDLKKLLAFSTITHLAYIFAALGIFAMGANIAFKGAILHLTGHAFAKALLFLTVGVISYSTGTRHISKLQGLSRNLPLLAFSFAIGFLSITGIPPFACFWSKFFILVSAFSLKTTIGIIFGILLLAESVASFIWFLVVFQRVFMGEPKTTEQIKVPFVLSITIISLIVLAIISPFVVLQIIGGL